MGRDSSVTAGIRELTAGCSSLPAAFDGSSSDRRPWHQAILCGQSVSDDNQYAQALPSYTNPICSYSHTLKILHYNYSMSCSLKRQCNNLQDIGHSCYYLPSHQWALHPTNPMCTTTQLPPAIHEQFTKSLICSYLLSPPARAGSSLSCPSCCPCSWGCSCCLLPLTRPAETTCSPDLLTGALSHSNSARLHRL